MPVGCSATTGCTDVEACNYDIDAQLDDGSCQSAFELYGLNRDCNGDCIDGMTEDACGICGGTNECCEANGDVYDCAGVCNGGHWESDCGCVPYGNSGDDCDDCFGVPNGFAHVDECGVCTLEPDGTGLFCCDNELICSPNTLDDCTNKIDDCDVCGGDGLSCDASILISDWEIYWNGVTWGFEAGDANTAFLNCNPAANDLCIESNIEQTGATHLDITIKAAGEGFADVIGGDAVLDIELTFGIYINRIVEVGGVEGTCDDIYGSVSSPVEATATFDAEYAGNGVFEFNFFAPSGTLPEDIDLFQDVVINGTTYTLNKNQDFNAVYQMRIYIKSYTVIGYDYDTENIVVNDIDNQIEAELTIHHDPLPEACPGLLGDANGNGAVTCADYFLANNWYDSHPPANDCFDYMDNPSAPDRCCNVAMLHGPMNQLTQSDLNTLLSMIEASGDFCLEP